MDSDTLRHLGFAELNMNLLRTIFLHALRHPRRVAIIDDRRTWSYATLAVASLFMSRHIERATAKPHVGLLLPTSGATPACILGAWLAQRTPVPLNFLLARDELHYVIAHSEIDTIFTVQPMLDFLGGPDVLPAGIKVVKLEDLSFKGIPPLRWPRRADPDALATMLYTSGTSGKPKGVMLTHGNLGANVGAITHFAAFTSATTFLGVLPQFHSFGLTALTLLPLALGATVVYSARFVPNRLLELMRQHKPDVFLGVPSMFAAMLSAKSVRREDFASVANPVSGGEPLPAVVAQQFYDRFGVRLCEGYGLTETSPVATWCLPSEYRPGSVGRALPGVEILIVDHEDKALSQGEQGEILLRGPNVMKGYFKDPKTTESVFVDLPDGRAFRTGDIGRLDADGHLFITGRKKEMLIVNGFNVFPRVIEECLEHHAIVKSCGVIGMNDPGRGEVPVAFVELHEGAEFDEPALRAWCRERLAPYQVPRSIVRVEAMPRGPTGKVLRRSLRDLLGSIEPTKPA
jgi:long-chain acyl-CoA synthetase